MGLSVLVILCSPFVLEAQVKPKPTAKTDRKLARAQSITDDIVKDAANLELIDRAVQKNLTNAKREVLRWNSCSTGKGI